MDFKYNKNKLDIFDIVGMIETVNVVPTYTPTKLSEQIKIYINGATKTLYIYSNTAQAWQSITLT